LTSEGDFSVRFWGVRGSIASPGPDTVKYGGNTSCVEVRCGGRVLVFDAGTGLRELGNWLAVNGDSEVDLFLSHTHIDHINGFPFFCFAFNSDNTLRVRAGHLTPEYTVEGVLRSFMSAPLFPVPVDIFHAKVSFEDFKAGATIDLGDGIVVRTAPLEHPDRATGYRVEFAGKAICYVTDTQRDPDAMDQGVIDLIAGADVAIYDAMFSDEEFAAYHDWGHSTWQECLRVCRAAGVTTPVIFHHLPGRGDDLLDDIQAAADREFRGALVAREGLVLTP
jgi:phosphoribosyl 1,2-cyclic phosphodiesterase